MAKHPYPLFSIAEREARWARVRAMMADESLDVIVAPNNTGHSLDFQADARYLSHCGGGGDSDIACVIPASGEVTGSCSQLSIPLWRITWPSVKRQM